jgi:hypothetical protein
VRKVAYIGNFKPDHSTENHYARAFEANGCRVFRLQEDEFKPDDARALHRQDGLSLLLYTRTWDLPMAEMWHLYRDLEADGVLTAAVHLDIWRGLDREHELVTQSMFRVGDFFSVDGDAGDVYGRAGINWHWCPPGVVADECYDAEPLPRDECPWDVAFVGSRGYHVEWPHRPELIDRLRAWYGDRFVHVGGDGDVPTTRGHDLNRFYATVPVIVGDSLGAHAGTSYWSDRFTETYGRGGFLIFPYIGALERLIGTSYPSWTIGFWEELKRLIDVHLADPETRQAVRRRVAYAVRTEHTYTQRAAAILERLGLR